MYDETGRRPELLRQGGIGDPPNAKRSQERLEPRLEDFVVPELLADDADAGTVLGGVFNTKTACVNACLDKGRDQGVVVHAITRNHGVEAADLVRGGQRGRHLISFPVEGNEVNIGLRPMSRRSTALLPASARTRAVNGGRSRRGQVIVEVSLEEPLDVRLVREDVAGHARGQAEGGER